VVCFFLFFVVLTIHAERKEKDGGDEYVDRKERTNHILLKRFFFPFAKQSHTSRMRGKDHTNRISKTNQEKTLAYYILCDQIASIDS
jgi:hypothetical protein